MSRVSINKVVLRNFRSFLGEHTVEFPDTGLVCIRGKNMDSGGESGAGKSAILHAIAYAFGFAPYSAKALQCWHTEEPVSVEVHGTCGEGPFVFTRGSSLSIVVNGVRTKGSAKAVEAELDRICGMNDRLRAALTYRGQKKPGLFLSMTDLEKKEFFIDILGIHWAEVLVETTSKTITALEKEEREKAAQLSSAEQLLNFAKQQIPTAPENNPEEAQEAVDSATEQFSTASKSYDDAKALHSQAEAEEHEVVAEIQRLSEERVTRLRLEMKAASVVKPAEFDSTELNRLEALLKECGERRAAVVEEDRAAAAEFTKWSRETSVKLERLRNEYKRRESYEQECAEVDRQIAILQEQRCSQCNQPWTQAKGKLDELIEQRGQLDGKIATAYSLPPMIESLERELATRGAPSPNPILARFDEIRTQLHGQIAAEKAKRDSIGALALAEQRAITGQFQTRIVEEQKKAAEEIAAILRDSNRQSAKAGKWVQDAWSILTTARSQRDAAVSTLTRIQKENADYLKRLDAAKAVIASHEAKVKAAATELEKVRRTLRTESDFLALVKGFLAAIFDDILAEITDEVNATLGRLPNVSHLTVRFVSDYQTQKGTTKQAIVPVACFNGEEHPLDSGCSGGMETSVELAVDFAVRRVVSRRKGVDLGFLSLDESFTGMDQVTKEACLEVLSMYASECLILIVDHGSEMKEAVSQRISVEYENELSRLAA